MKRSSFCVAGRVLAAVMVLLSVLLLLVPVATAREFKLLYTFSGQDGETPRSGLIMDAAGNLYGTTFWVAPMEQAQFSNWHRIPTTRGARLSSTVSPAAPTATTPGPRCFLTSQEISTEQRCMAAPTELGPCSN